MAQRDDVRWNRVAEAHDSWDYHSQGLSGPGAAIVAIAVAIATQGAGSALLGPAAFTSLVSQASISLINNQGNLGKVLAELGSSAGLQELAGDTQTMNEIIAGLPLELVPMASSLGRAAAEMKAAGKLAQTAEKNEFSDILSPQTRQHILYGDAPGKGGHLWPGQPGKLSFRKAGPPTKLSMKSEISRPLPVPSGMLKQVQADCIRRKESPRNGWHMKSGTAFESVSYTNRQQEKSSQPFPIRPPHQATNP